ncbi:hypothetical protein BKA70DRAFT_1518103 [Coprinopsis sp. MPI-PUGE-AT-0042]|nr:hypothetical protein BKA70DRAFT_1518103 [Coprinopsis sp. MPI-PUGE-AT-0042]
MHPTVPNRDPNRYTTLEDDIFDFLNGLTIDEIGDIQEQIRLERQAHKRFGVLMSGANSDVDNGALNDVHHHKEHSVVGGRPHHTIQQPKPKYNTNKSLPPTPQATPQTDRFPDIDIPVIFPAKEYRRKRATTILNDPSSMARFRDENKSAIAGLLQTLELQSDGEDEEEQGSDDTVDLGDYLRRRLSRSSTTSFVSRSSVWADEHHASIFRVASDAPPVPFLDTAKYKGDAHPPHASDAMQKPHLQRSFSSTSTLSPPSSQKVGDQGITELSDRLSTLSAISSSTFDLDAFPAPPTHLGSQAPIASRLQPRSDTSRSAQSLSSRTPGDSLETDFDARRLSTASTASVYSQASMAPTGASTGYFTAAPNAPPVPALPTRHQQPSAASASSSSTSSPLGRGPKGSRFVEMDRWDQSLRMSFASAAPPTYSIEATIAVRKPKDVRPAPKVSGSSPTDKVKFAVQSVKEKVVKAANNRSLSEGILQTASLGRGSRGSRPLSSRPAIPTRVYSHVVNADEHYKGATVVSTEELQKDLARFGANPLQGTWYSPGPPQASPGTSWYRHAPTSISPPPKGKRPATS